MNKIGMFGGKFLIPTMGHLRCIVEASTKVDILYVILCYNEELEKPMFKGAKIKPIEYMERLRWLKQMTKDMPNVHILQMHDDYNWENGANTIKRIINAPIHTVFFGGDYEVDMWKELYPESKEFYKFDRTDEVISATKIRMDGPFKHWDDIPNIVKPYFIKKVCIVGTESCGKSTLVNNLALYYNTNQVKEYGRDVCDEAGGELNMDINDYKKILCGQVMLEEEAVKYSNKLLFVDSEQIVTQYYLTMSEGGFGPQGIAAYNLADNLSILNEYDLILLMAPTVKWVDDGTRIHGDQSERESNHKRLKRMYEDHNIAYIEITEDNYNDRFKQAVTLINEIVLGE